MLCWYTKLCFCIAFISASWKGWAVLLAYPLLCTALFFLEVTIGIFFHDFFFFFNITVKSLQWPIEEQSLTWCFCESRLAVSSVWWKCFFPLCFLSRVRVTYLHLSYFFVHGEKNVYETTYLASCWKHILYVICEYLFSKCQNYISFLFNCNHVQRWPVKDKCFITLYTVWSFSPYFVVFTQV